MGYKTIALSSVVFLAGSSLSCERRLECGEGTIGVDGVCQVDVTSCANECICGDGAHADDSGVCVADTDYSHRSDIDPTRNATGFTGAALMVHSGLVPHSGIGGLPDGYQWEAELANCTPDVVQVLRLHDEPVPAAASPAHGYTEGTP